MENQTTKNYGTVLTDTMSFGRKIAAFFTFLQAGQELEIDGRTYVWLDNHITSERVNSDGETEYMGIDGLALKGTSTNSGTGVSKPHYMGQNDMPFSHLRDIIENLTEEQLFQMTAGIALLGMNKKRVLKGDQ